VSLNAQLKAVIFDFGGVIIRTRSQHFRRQWEARLGLAPGQAEAIVFGTRGGAGDGASGWAAQHGQITSDEHWQWIGQRLGLDQATLAAFRRDFFAEDIIDRDLVAYIDRLAAAGYHIGVLSNTPDTFRPLFVESWGLDGHFDSLTLSCEEGVMKPDPRIFRIALEKAGVQPAEALFVDDFIENVEGARAAGMLAVHFRDPDVARQEIAALTGVE
jgi:epoxide hydrolase-like predicted phosphatase